ncbi:hypothetical protein B0H14DRAFT_2600902 [Mycena olivaceomarginata]|nr:hypothetical protein B0H14DRAFT_2600902 [Mycena olivaceomarginata]
MPTPDEIAQHKAKLAAAMLADSPAPLVRKRKDPPGTNPDESNDHEDDDQLPTIPSSDAPTEDLSGTNSNMVAFARQYATHKRLKPSQVTEVEAFAADPLAAHQVKLFTLVLGVNSKLESIIAAQPAFKVSPSLDKNLRQLTHGIMISSRLASYKGELAKKHLLNIVKKNRFDLPPGIENVASDWGLVKSRGSGNVQEVYTETTLTVELCARIALMRQQYKFYPGDDFWDKLNAELTWMRKQAGYDEHKIAKAFKQVLADDRADHGKSAEYTLPEDAVVDVWQASVDTSINTDSPDA